MRMMPLLRQICAVTLTSLRGIPGRIGTSLVIVVGIAGVVAVLVSVLSMAVGLDATVKRAGRLDRAVVLRSGARFEIGSALTRNDIDNLRNAPFIKKTEFGDRIISADAVLTIELPLKESGSGADVTLRGVGPLAWRLRPEVQVTDGRLFTPGRFEIIAGRSAQSQFSGLEIGSHLTLWNTTWTVVGTFGSNGDAHESELFADAETVLTAHHRDTYQSFNALLNSANSFEGFKRSLTSNPTLSVEAKRESDYFSTLSARLDGVLTFVGYFIGGIMAVGALFSALNTMYSAVSSRRIEIATLRAIGFSATPIVVSIFVEALLLAISGGAAGALLAIVFFDGHTLNSLSGNFSQVVFRLDVTPELVTIGFIWAILIGFLGALFPALKAARLPVAMALRP